MVVHRLLRQLMVALCLVIMTVAGVLAQAPPDNNEFQPVVGQAGKDVIWVPTPQALADKMVNLAQVTPQDYVIDLGSGDGRIVITAAKRGAQALGIEYEPAMVELSKRNAAKEGVADRAKFIKADLFESDFSAATVLTMFLLPDINLRLRPVILNLKPGTRVASNTFDMGEWKADQTVTVTKEEGCDSYYCQAYLWIVPAKVEGKWRLPNGELVLSQSFQMVSGDLISGANRIPVADGRLSGDRISFRIGGALYTGRIVGTAMEGTFTSDKGPVAWSANRISN